MAGRLRAEFWTLPSSGTFKKICDLPMLAGSAGTAELSAWSDATVRIPATFNDLAKVRPPSANGLVRVYDDDKVVYEFRPVRLQQPEGRPTQYDLVGPEIKQFTERIAVYPWRYPQESPEMMDWIWGGPNALPDLSLAALGNIQETWMFYLERERYGLKINDATEGQIVIRYDDESDAANPISFDPSASAIKSAVESLDGITEAYVVEHEDESFTIVILNPTKLDGVDLEVVGANGFDGSIEFQKEAEGFDSLADPEPAFFVLVDAGNGEEQTEAFPWNVAATTLDGDKVGTPTGIAGLPSVNDVKVTGHGHFGSPFEVVFVDPPKIRSFRVDFSAGDVVVERQVVGRFDPSPITRSKPLDAGAGPEEQHGKYGTPDIEIITGSGIIPAGSDWILRVNAEGRYAGAQVTARVKPGGTYQASVPVRPTVDGLYTLVIRDLAGNLIAQPSPRDNFLEAGTWGFIPIENVRIPDTVDEVIFRVAVTDPAHGAQAPFYVDFQHAELREGMPPATYTKAIGQLLDAAHGRGTATWLGKDFDDGHDSAGKELEEIEFTAYAFSYLSQVLDEGNEMDYKWRIAPLDEPDDGVTHVLQIYHEGEAEDLTAEGGGPVVRAGVIEEGSVVSRSPDFSVGIAWGADNQYAEQENSGLVSVVGRLERVLDVEPMGESTLTQALNAKFREQSSNATALTARVRGDAQRVPLVDYREGSKIWWEFPGKQARVAKAVGSVTWTIDSTGLARYDIYGSRVFSKEAGLVRAVNKLLSEFRRRRVAERRGGERRVVGALGAHIHTVLSSPQSLTANTPATLVWDNIGFIAPDNFPRPDFPTDTVTVQEPGYYDFKVEFGLSDFVTAGKVEIVRVRGGVEVPVWPEPFDPGIWDVTNWPTSRFSDTAKAIPCLSGDEIKVYVTVNGDVDVESAVFTGELVDRTIIQASQASLAFTTFHKPGIDPSPGTYDLPMPGVGPGDVVFAAVVSNPPNEDDTSIDGWTKLGQFDGSVISGAVFYRVVDGTEGGTATLTTLTVSGAILSAVLWRVQDPQVDWGAAPPDFAIVGNSRDAPSVAVSHGPGVYWVFPVAFFSSYFGPSGPPDYEEIAYIEGTSAQGARVYVAQAKTQVGTSVDPGLFSYDHEIQASRNWHSATVAVKVTG